MYTVIEATIIYGTLFWNLPPEDLTKALDVLILDTIPAFLIKQMQFFGWDQQR